MSERQVKYLRHDDRAPSLVCEAPLWAFLFDQPYFNASNCGVLPLLPHLNTMLKSGRTVNASWEPFEVTPEEYAALVPKLLEPDHALLEQFSSHKWQVFQADPSLDHYSDFAEWQLKAREKHQQSWGLRLAKLQHEMLMSAQKKG